jgi:serine carboxypeptidase-like clade II
MSDELYHNILKYCRHFSDDTGRSDTSNQHMKCYGLLDKFYETMKGDICMNSLYSTTCTNISTATGQVQVGGLQYMGYDPCSSNYIEVYFIHADVQKALHATTTKNGRPWVVCRLPVFNNWQDSSASMLPVIKLIGAGVCIWVYSGDTDDRLPTAGTRLALRKLKL